MKKRGGGKNELKNIACKGIPFILCQVEFK